MIAQSKRFIFLVFKNSDFEQNVCIFIEITLNLCFQVILAKH